MGMLLVKACAGRGGGWSRVPFIILLLNVLLQPPQRPSAPHTRTQSVCVCISHRAAVPMSNHVSTGHLRAAA
eukprot:2504634-Rhodomonas_salina.1